MNVGKSESSEPEQQKHHQLQQLKEKVRQNWR